jgi:glutamate-1-semialdehyde 2,1-aminomutase
VRTNGCRVWDEEGREYLDLVMALGAVALGYGHPDVNAGAERAIRDGVAGPLPHVLESEVAELLTAVIPGAESVRFLKTGAEAVAAAVRIARAYTGREHVVTCGYHGWLDWCQLEIGVPHAITQLRSEVPFNDAVALQRAADDFGPIAAIVIEPVYEGEPDLSWLSVAREVADRAGAVLIFDEIKTAFRIAVGGAAERYGVVPDIAVVGKAFGNGFPIAAVCGPKDLMNAANRTWISSTLATEHMSLGAAKAVIETYEREDVVGVIQSNGRRLMAGFEDIAARLSEHGAEARGVPQMCFLNFADSDKAAVFASRAAAKGVIFKRTAYNFVSYAHTDDDLSEILARMEEVAEEVRQSC